MAISELDALSDLLANWTRSATRIARRWLPRPMWYSSFPPRCTMFSAMSRSQSGLALRQIRLSFPAGFHQPSQRGLRGAVCG